MLGNLEKSLTKQIVYNQVDTQKKILMLENEKPILTKENVYNQCFISPRFILLGILKNCESGKIKRPPTRKS